MPDDKNGEGIYVASRVVRAPIWQDYRKRGLPITASWIDEAGEGETADFGELWARIRGEIASSRALVFYAQGIEDFPFKGALVEVGMALAMGKPVFVCINDVALDGRTLRPLGSWALDRNVTMCDTLEEAMQKAFQCPLPLALSSTAATGETPRTDASAEYAPIYEPSLSCSPKFGYDVVSADFARQLERELAEVKKAHAEAIEQWSHWEGIAKSHPSATRAIDIPDTIRRSTWKTRELRDSAAKLVEVILKECQ